MSDPTCRIRLFALEAARRESNIGDIRVTDRKWCINVKVMWHRLLLHILN